MGSFVCCEREESQPSISKANSMKHEDLFRFSKKASSKNCKSSRSSNQDVLASAMRRAEQMSDLSDLEGEELKEAKHKMKTSRIVSKKYKAWRNSVTNS